MWLTAAAVSLQRLSFQQGHKNFHLSWRCQVSPCFPVQVIVTDTAGLRETLDPIEAEGVALAQETALQADLVLSVLDCTALPDADSSSFARGLPFAPAMLQGIAAVSSGRSILVLNKADALLPGAFQQLQQQLQQQLRASVTTSAQLLGDLDASSAQQVPAGAVVAGYCKDAKGGSGVDANLVAIAPAATVAASAGGDTSPSGGSAVAAGSTPAAGNALAGSSTEAADTTIVSSSTSAAGNSQAGSSTSAADETIAISSTQAAARGEVSSGGLSSRVVLCSCKTGLHMDALTAALERAVQEVMQQGQGAEEGFAITR